MMRGGTPRAFCAGIWNCTYIWPIMIWFGVNVWFGLFGAGTVAYSVTFGTPPMKKLPWSSITSGLLRNLFILLPFSPSEVTAVETSRMRQSTKQCRRFIKSSSFQRLFSVGPTGRIVSVHAAGVYRNNPAGGPDAEKTLKRGGFYEPPTLFCALPHPARFHGRNFARRKRQQDEEVSEQAAGDRRPGQFLHRRRTEGYRIRDGACAEQSEPDIDAEPDHDWPDVRAVPDPGAEGAGSAASHHGPWFDSHGSMPGIHARRA